MLSVIILSHNSARSIADTLTSVKFADEILVIDDASTDDTEGIVKKNTSVRFISHPLAGDFASQRNFALQQSKHEWVFFVDSDEVVSPQLADEIREHIGKSDVVGYRLRRHDVLWGKELRYGEIGAVRLLRLAKRTAGIWKRPVHEEWQIEGKISELHNPLLHYPHPSVSEFFEEINSYATRNAGFMLDEGTNMYAWQIPVYPLAKFVQNYIFRQGFRDGTPGIIVALFMSYHSFLTRAKGWLLCHPQLSVRQ